MTGSKSRQEHFLPELAQPISHYTHAVSFENMLFVSGLVGYRDGVLPEDIVLQTRHLFDNLTDVLVSVGASFQDILKVTVYLTDIADRREIDPVRIEYFGEDRPASTLIEISRLARPEAKIEIDAVVGLPPE